MKKIISSIAITMFLSGQAMAAPLLAQSTNLFTTTSSQSSFQGNIKINNQDQTSLNSFFQTLVASIQLNPEYNQKEQQVATLLLEAFDDTNIEIISQDNSTVITTNYSNSEFTDLLEGIRSNTTLTETSMSSETIYKFLFRDFAFAFINEKLVVAENSQDIQVLLPEISNTQISLSNNSILELDGSFSDTSFDFSLTKDGDILNYLSETTLQNESDLTYLNSDTHLYETLPAESPIMYLEFNNLLEIIELGANTLDPTLNTEISTSIQQELSPELPSYETILNKQLAILIDNVDQRLPNLTLALDKISSSEAQEINTLLNALADEIVLSSDELVSIQKTEINSELNKLSFSFDPVTEFNDFGIENLDITYGKLNDTFIISTNSNIISETQSSSGKLNNVSKFQNSMATETPATIGNFYFDFPELGNYLTSINSNPDTQNLPVEDSYLDILNKMNVWSGTSYTSQNMIIEAGSLSIPFQDLADSLQDSLQAEFTKSSSFNYNPFTDVPSDAWFADDVSQAYESYIIDTYDYQTEEFSYEFNPGNEITRGEFIQMIIQAYEVTDEPAQYGSEIFSDVEFGAYYDYAIGIGFEKGIINGDDNADTFRPNDTLNRAEAVQILYNVSPLLNGKFADEEKFIDVAKDAWYANVVAVATQEAIVEGINAQEFAPAKKLNKAEAVTLLIRLVNNEVRL